MLIKEGKTNVKYILIVVVFAIITGGGILLLSARPSLSEEKYGATPAHENQEGDYTTSEESNVPPQPIDQKKATSFNFPYPASWEEQWSYVYNSITWGEYITTYNLIGVSLGEKVIKSYPPIGFKVGDSIYALSLKVKVNSENISTQGGLYCVPVKVLRILNEEGDTQNAFDPIIRLENGACLNGSDDTQIGEIDFVVTQDQTEFLFLPSRESDAAFLIRVTDKNMLEVEQIPAEG